MDNFKLHHIGVATKNIEKEFKYFSSLGYKKESDIFNDYNQKIKGVFIVAGNQPRLELLENLDGNGPLTNYLNKGNKFYHFAYETKNIEQDFKEFVNNGALVICPIIDATYFKKVCFLMLKNMMLIELVEKNN